MPVDGEALLKAVVLLAEVEEMQVTIKNTFAASAVTALAGTGGFLLLGPAGIFVGSTLAGLGAYCYSKNKFKPVFVILKEDLRPQQQQELIDLLRKTFADLDHTDLVKLCMLMMNNRDLWERMRNFLVVWMGQYFMKTFAVNDVHVEMKQMTELEKYRKFTEAFKKQEGLPGAACPPALGACIISNSGVSTAAPGWRSEISASTAGIELLRATTPKATATSFPPEAGKFAQPIPASNWAVPHSSEENQTPAAPKTILKTTF